ncbi:hypothetical protein HNQ50_002459 [Silvimonas terrae]|uniref:DUF4166 domain-containing protein n=1 Tax=Silvimonas terrae TaxID=300266 RepID=A0A840RE00_9NEIS|nr:DUF4166 domain-containing protein [Silvimonas terrae]MBB5191729.1 hypothetical protein [Silvimonas terrae]
MKSLMQQALGDDWAKLPPALQAHYRSGKTTDIGHMNIEYPRFMQWYLSVLHVFGALINRRGENLSTTVEKDFAGERQYWRRTIKYPDGRLVRFNSFWIAKGPNQLVEFVNPLLGLQMKVRVHDSQLHYQGVKFVVKLGPLLLPIPEWLALGHTDIVEVAVNEKQFVMDFRLTHPLLGQIFRYSGKFEAAVSQTCESSQAP